MKLLRIFLFESRHFRGSLSKILSCVLFFMACLFALYSGSELQHKQQVTIQNMQNEHAEEVDKSLGWFETGENGPADRDWVDIHQPYWALQYVPTAVFKNPPRLLALGTGQTEQYGYYKEITFWSAIYDNEMVEELANPERLVGGNIDFSFLVIYLLPLLLIILTYNVGGLERDASFERLVSIQFGSITKWLGIRFSFYVLLVLIPIIALMAAVAAVNGSLFQEQLWALVVLASSYIALFSLLYFVILVLGTNSSSVAFKMIGAWLIFCLVIPGSVHQVANMKVPVSYMTDYLDVVRKDTYAMFSSPTDTQSERLFQAYPELLETEAGQDLESASTLVRKSLSAVINEMNKKAAEQIEVQSELKNQFIRSSYWYNPVSFVQNRWNSITGTDYYAFKDHRQKVQLLIDAKLERLVFDTWNQTTVDKKEFQSYLSELHAD